MSYCVNIYMCVFMFVYVFMFVCVCLHVCVCSDLPVSVQGETATRNKVTLVQDVLSRLNKDEYSIEELTSKPLPEGVDPLNLEIYLSDQDFKVNKHLKTNTKTSRHISSALDIDDFLQKGYSLSFWGNLD